MGALLANTTVERLSAFTWYGGKALRLKWLLPLLPQDCEHYIEPFGGSAAVLLNRPPSPVETLNDLDGEVVNFFRVLRDRTEELERLLTLTPCARQEFVDALDLNAESDIERARRFYIRSIQSYAAKPDLLPSSFAPITKSNNTVKGISAMVARWFTHIDMLPVVAARLLLVQIENLDALNLIERYDSPGAFFYCDPPYVMRDRQKHASVYRHEPDEEYHRQLAELLHRVEGRVAVSGYHGVYDELYADWRLHEEEVVTVVGERGATRTECLWMNYEAVPVEGIQQPLALFP